MLPVSGAEQLKLSGPIGERPMISHSGAYSRFESALGSCLRGTHMFHRPAAFALALSSPMIGGASHRSFASSTCFLYIPSAGKTCFSMNSLTRRQSSMERSDWGGNMGFLLPVDRGPAFLF